MVPDAYLAALSVDKRAIMWTSIIAAATTEAALVSKYRNGTWTLNAADSSSSVPNAQQQAKIKLPSSSQKQHDRLNDLEGKNRDLEIKLRRMTKERDVLKKAMAYCLHVPK